MENEPREFQDQKKKRPPINYARYSAMGFQMGATIALGVWGGRYLDSYFQNKFPAFTLVLSLFSVAAAMYWAVRDFIKKDK